MNKLLINLTACAFGLVLSSTGIAADQTSPEKGAAPEVSQPDTQAPPADKAGDMSADKSTQTDPQAAPNTKPASEAAADKGNKPEDVNEAYTAALKKCDALSGAQKDTCEKKAKKEHGKM
jgi:hypothetical protein